LAESHVLSALKQKRAMISGEIIVVERRIGDLRAALVHLDGTMRLFAGDEINPEAIVPKLPKAAPALPAIMPRGDMTRLVLDALRQGVGSQGLGEIVEKVAGTLGVGPEDRKSRRSLTERVRNTLYRLRDRNAIESLRDGASVLWRIAAD